MQKNIEKHISKYVEQTECIHFFFVCVHIYIYMYVYVHILR